MTTHRLPVRTRLHHLRIDLADWWSENRNEVKRRAETAAVAVMVAVIPIGSAFGLVALFMRFAQ